MQIPKSKKQERRLRRRAQRTPRFHAVSVPLLYPILLSLPGVVLAQAVTPASPKLTEILDPAANSLSAKAHETQDNAGKPTFEILRGGGGLTGSLLRHGNVLTDTVSLALNGRTLKFGKDYTLDALSGSLYFSVPVTAADSISVYYRYLDTPQGASTERTTSLLPAMRFNLGSTTQLGFAYGMVSDAVKGTNTTTYGFGLNTNFGAKKTSSLGGRYYFSNAQANQNTSLMLDGSAPAPAYDPANEGSDHLLTQNLGLTSGNFRFHADYQDVGRKFNGFSALKQGAKDADDLAQITALEGEKGIKRLGFGLGLGTGSKKNTIDGFSFNLNTISDENDSISQKMFGFNSQQFQFRYATREVGEKFAKFSGLREGEKKQWQREHGLKVSSLGFGLGFGSTKGAGVAGSNGLRFDQQSFGEAAGSLSRQTIALTSGAIRLEMMSRNSETKFSRLNDLSNEDKNSLALDTRRQFDPNAKAEQISEADRQQLVKEAGLNRSGLRLDLTPGKNTGFSFGQMRLSDNAGATSATDSKSAKDGQETHGFSRNAVSLNTSRINFAMITQSAERGFTRLGDLSDTERSLLASDIYRMANPSAKPEMVSANDRNFFAKGIEMRRQMMRFDAGLTKGLRFGFSDSTTTDLREKTEGQSFSRQSLTLGTSSWDVSYLKRNADKKFGRIADLTDGERQTLALDIRRQFDPNAKGEQVTPHERELAINEAGISRTGMNVNAKLGKAGTLGQVRLNQFSLTDKTGLQNGDISRNVFDYTGKTIYFSFLKQSISSRFSRLSDLNDFERLQFANEGGLDKSRLGFTWQEDKNTKIGFSSFKVGGNASAIETATETAKKAGKEVALAMEAAGAGMSRDNLSIDTKGFFLNVNRAETGKGFTRSGDLAMTDAERNTVAQERGYRRFDVASKFALGKWFTADIFQLAAKNDGDKLSRDNFKNALNFNPNAKTSISFLSEGDVWETNGVKNGNSRNFIQVKQEFFKGYLFNWSQDNNAVYTKDVANGGAQVDRLQFQTPEALPTGMRFEQRTTAFKDGRNERLASLNVHSKPTKTFKIGFSRTDIDRDTDPSETVDTVDFAWQASPKFSVLAAISNRDMTQKSKTDADGKIMMADNGKGDISTVSFGIQGEPAPNISLTAKFDEIHNVTDNTRDTADFALSNSKPFKFGCISDLTFTARYASLNDQRKMQNETMTGRASWKIWKNEFLVDYGGQTLQNGTSSVSRLYSFTTDPNPKRPIRGSFYYKVRDMLDGEKVTIRRFTADAKLTKRTHFSYTYGNLAEDERANIIPSTTADVSLKHGFTKDLDFHVFYRLSDNSLTKIMTRSMGFALEGKLDKWSRLTLGYSADGDNTATTFERSNHFRFAFERSISANQFFTLSTDIKSHAAPGIVDEVQASVDFRLRF